MCKEDIRIARLASAKAPITALAGSIATMTLPGNPNRYALAVGITVADETVTKPNILVYSLFAGGKFPLAVLTNEHASATISLLDVGQAVTGQIVFETKGAAEPTAYYLGETAFDAELDKL